MIKILQGDCREVLATLPDASVQCCVTSPPYWGLRDYGTGTWEGGNIPTCDHLEIHAQAREGRETPGGRGGSFPQSARSFKKICRKCGATKTDSQIGLEQSPDEYVAELVAVFREVWRVLRGDGTVWLNVGDAYASTPSGKISSSKLAGGQSSQTAFRGATKNKTVPIGLKPKDLIGLPWMIAFALRADGWYLRQDNIWAKRNCMPESVTDRTTRAHEYLFMFTKSGDKTFWTHRDKAGTRSQPDPDYRWVHADTKQELLATPTGWPEIGKKVWRRVNLWRGHDYFYDAVAIEEDGDIPAGTRAAKGSAARADVKNVNGRPPEYYEYTGKRNKRSVWHVATQPFAEAHFATMPPAIVETCVLAGSSERGCCSGCGAPWARRLGDRAPAEGRSSGNKTQVPGADRIAGASHVGRGFPYEATIATTVGWTSTCDCSGEPNAVPCTILDPFGGSGTTGLVADRLGRDAILLELNPEYIEIAKRRLTKDAGMFAEIIA